MARRLIVCCDGTWNKPDQLSGGVGAPTNVAKLALAIARRDRSAAEQLVYYQKGVGTRRFERIRGGAFGWGLSRDVRCCYHFIVENYQRGDELWFFGFSRGAFTARSTAGLVRNAGVLRRARRDLVDEAYRLYRGRGKRGHPNGLESSIFRRMHSHEDVNVHFIGVWDTVGSLGIPIDALRLASLVNQRWGFHDTDLSSRVHYAYQALAIDEKRGPFKPTLWRQQEHTDRSWQMLEQVWFAGVHSDVGGGYRDPQLSEIPLLWMVDRARAAGLAFEDDHFRRPELGVAAELRRTGEFVDPDPLGLIHESRTGFYRLLPRHERRPGDPSGSAQSVASTAVVRRREMAGDYLSPQLDRYLEREGQVSDMDGDPA